MEARLWNTTTHFFWEETKGSGSDFSLSTDDGLAGTLTGSGWNSLPRVATTPFGEWELKNESLLRSRLVVHDRRTGALVAECPRRWMSSRWQIEFPDGAAYTWEPTGWWSQTYALCGAAGEPIITVHEGQENFTFRDLFRMNGRMHVHAIGSEPVRLSLLGMLAWYFLLQYRQDASGAVVF